MHNPPVIVSSVAASCAPRGASALSLAGFVRVLTLTGVFSLLAAGCGGTTEDRPAKWSLISATIVEPMCATASCHSAFAQRAGVDLHERDLGYRVLTERHFVIPSNAGASAVISLMRAQGSIRMPPDFPLPEADIKLFEDWINAGATNQ